MAADFLEKNRYHKNSSRLKTVHAILFSTENLKSWLNLLELWLCIYIIQWLLLFLQTDEFEGKYATYEKQFFAIFSKTKRNFSNSFFCMLYVIKKRIFFIYKFFIYFD